MSLRERPAPRGSPASRYADPVPVPHFSPIPKLLDLLLAADPSQAAASTLALPPDLTGPVDDLPPDLDHGQRSAVMLALHTPDVALIRTLAADQSRLVAAVIASAGRRRETVAVHGDRPPTGRGSGIWGLVSRMFGHRPTAVPGNDVPATYSDLIIVPAAHAADDTELRAAAGRARRAVFFGEAGDGIPACGSPFGRLWALLHCEPWRREGERLVCRLRSVPPGGRREREPVADRPDVELCIHTPADGPPELVEVAFPADTPVARAVEYVFKELGELPVSSGAEPVLHTSGRVHGMDCADLGDGVRVVIAPTGAGWAVPAVEFGAGWDRDRATAWMQRHVVRPGPGRTVDLTR